MANTIAACVGGKDIQSLVACPCTVGKTVEESFVKFNRRQILDAMRYVYKYVYKTCMYFAETCKYRTTVQWA